MSKWKYSGMKKSLSNWLCVILLLIRTLVRTHFMFADYYFSLQPFEFVFCFSLLCCRLPFLLVYLVFLRIFVELSANYNSCGLIPAQLNGTMELMKPSLQNLCINSHIDFRNRQRIPWANKQNQTRIDSKTFSCIRTKIRRRL